MSVLKAILLTLLLIFVFSVAQIGFILIFLETELIPEHLQKHFGIATTLSFVVAYLVLFKFFWKPNLNIRKSLILENYNLKFLPYLILIVLGLQLVNRPFWDLERFWDLFNHTNVENDFGTFKGFNPAFFYRSISLLLVAPVFEELFFRKFLLQKLLEKSSCKIGVLISSLCFAIIHMETPLNLIPAFIFGAISSLLFIKTKKIGYSICFHFLANLLVSISGVFDHTFDRWLLALNFNFTYWLMFLIGIGITYFGTKKLLAITSDVP